MAGGNDEEGGGEGAVGSSEQCLVACVHEFMFRFGSHVGCYVDVVHTDALHHVPAFKRHVPDVVRA